MAIILLIFFNGGISLLFLLPFSLFVSTIFLSTPLTLRLSKMDLISSSVVVFVIFSIISALSATNGYATSHHLISIITSAMIFFIIRDGLSNEDRKKLETFMVKMIFFYSIASLIPFFMTHVSIDPRYDYSDKLHSTMGHYNHFGTLILFILPIVHLSMN